jgi:hypothetical protein
MNTKHLFALVALAVLPAAFAASPSLELGVASVETSGFRPYAAKHNLNKNETTRVTVPTVRLGYPITRNFSMGLSYCRYADLKSSGFANSSDVFNEGGAALMVITPIKSCESVREFALDGRYLFTVTEKIGFELGLVLSQFNSKAEMGTAFEVIRPSDNAHFIDYRKLREFKADDYRLGATAAVRFSIAKAWSLIASYRYAAPPERKMHLCGLALGYRF